MASESLGCCHRQLDAAVNGKWSEAEKEQSSHGIKDRHLLHFLDELRRTADDAEKRGLSPEDTVLELKRLRESWPQDDILFNPAFGLSGSYSPYRRNKELIDQN